MNIETTEKMSEEMSALKTKLKSTWESGDYSEFAKYLEPGALEFFDRLNIPAGTRLLDIGCGAGQLTIPAAKRGIDVVGIDLAQNLVDKARERAIAEGIEFQVQQGDAEALPFPDESFDMSLSLIGSMFAPQPNLVASEMLRVTRKGGKIIMGNWTPEGHVGQMFKVIGKHVPPPSIFPSPLLWGKEEIVRERFGDGLSGLTLTKRMYPFTYPVSPEGVVDIFMKYYGPTLRAYAALQEEARPALIEDLTNLWKANNEATDGTVKVQAEYLELIGVRS